MKRIALALIRLYPPNWRQRYGEEFEALLEENPTTLSTVFDLLKGALKMQLNAPSFPKMAVVLSLVGVLVGFGVSFAVTPRYVSNATLTYTAASPKDFNGNLLQDFMQQKTQIESRTSLSNAMQDPRLDIYRSERSTMPLEDVIEKMRGDLNIQTISPRSSDPGSLTFQISFTYPDATKARDGVQVVLTKFADANLTRVSVPTPSPEDSRRNAFSGINLDVIDPPSLQADPISPKRSAFMLAGFGIGFALALLIAIFRRTSPPIPFPAQTI